MDNQMEHSTPLSCLNHSKNAISEFIIVTQSKRKVTKMNFEVYDTIDLVEIQKSSSQLTQEHICEISLNSRGVINDITPSQLVFLLACLSKFGTNFENNISLIELYLKNIEDNNIKLNLEQILYVYFLKKYENEDNFNSFFNIFSKSYAKDNFIKSHKKPYNDIWFFMHTPVFLAHSNAMFQLLEQRENRAMKITIACLSSDPHFKKKCQDIDVNFVPLTGETLVSKYKFLIEKSRKSLALCWNGPPVHLDYVSKRTNNTIWWTHRMHSSFEHVNLRLSAASYDQHDTFYRFGKKWNYFDSSFKINNWNKPLNWEIRKANFGTFCREDLIDKKEHWENVSVILSKNTSMTYHYCGKREIHKEWCKNLKIDQKKINFLGWLVNPEREILNMAFLLDGGVMGHGLMGMEALAGKIPIIQPYNTPGFYDNFLKQIKFQKEEQIISRKISATVFRNKKELCSISSDLIHYTLNLRIAEIMHKKYEERVRQAGTFNEFINLTKV